MVIKCCNGYLFELWWEFYETNKFSIIEPCKVDKKKKTVGFVIFFLKKKL